MTACSRRLIALASVAAGLAFFIARHPAPAPPSAPSISARSHRMDGLAPPNPTPVVPSPFIRSASDHIAAPPTVGLAAPDPGLEPRVAALCGHLLLLADGTLLSADEQAEIERRLRVSPFLALEWVTFAPSAETSDQRLVGVLFAWARLDFEAAWVWAESQGDMLPCLAVLGSASDQIDAALRASHWAERSPADGLYRADYLSRLWRELGYHAANLAFAESLPTEQRAIFIPTALEFYARHSPEEALNYVLRQEEPSERESALLAVVSGWPGSKLPELRRLLPTFTLPAVASLAEHKLAREPTN